MITLSENSDRLIQRVPSQFRRYLLSKIDFKNRLIGIKGARGTSKTTLLLQRLYGLGKPVSETAYFPMDDLYFLSHTLYETAQQYYQQDGKLLALDEVHKYPRWSQEIKRNGQIADEELFNMHKTPTTPMAICNINNGKTERIRFSEFKLEKDLQCLFEGNLKTFFNYRFVITEFSTGNTHSGRIDTLALSEYHNPPNT